MDLDLACAFRLEIYEEDKAKLLAKRIATYVMKTFNGEEIGDDD